MARNNANSIESNHFFPQNKKWCADSSSVDTAVKQGRKKRGAKTGANSRFIDPQEKVDSDSRREQTIAVWSKCLLK